MALSAASRRLKLFEEEVGAPLVKRLPQGVELTTAGITAERYAQSVLRMAEEHSSGVRGRIRVCASSSALVTPVVIARLSTGRPSNPARLRLNISALEYWIPACAGMTGCVGAAQSATRQR
jgi:DNA-binding transcriptional LysR family regulator